MKLFDALRTKRAPAKIPRGERGADDKRARVLDRDRDGRALYEEDILAKLREEYSRRREERLPLERTWTLNANFFSGNQNCGLNEESGELQAYAPLRDYEEQGVYNRIAPLVETRIASLRALTYAMTVRPHTNESEDAEKSEIATALLRHTQAASDFEAKKDVLLQLSELYGTAFVLSYWDPHAAGSVATENADEALPLRLGSELPREGACTDTPPAHGENAANEGTRVSRKRENGENEGSPAAEKGAREAPGRGTSATDAATPSDPADDRRGEIGYGILSPFEVFPEDLSRPNVGDQGSILLARVMTVDEIRDTYGVSVPARRAAVYGSLPVSGGIIAGHGGAVLAGASVELADSATVLTYMERPNAHHPAGRLIIATEETLLWFGDLPYEEIPLVAFKCKDAVGQFFGRSAITDLIPLQRAYNGAKNKIHDYIRAVAANPILLPEGAIPDVAAFAAEGLPPGEIVEYNPERGKPEPLPPAPLPAELRYECERLAADMEYTAGVSQLMVVGKTPSGVTSGTAIENLRRIDSTRLALTGENLRRGVRRLAVIWLRIYKRYLTGERTLSLAGANAAAGVYAFTAEDINSFDVVFDTENELLVPPEVQRENFLRALNLGLFLDENGRLPRAVKVRARQMLALGGEGDLLGTDDLALDAAARENAAALLGEAPVIGLFDDHELHIEMHKKCLLGARYAFFKRKNPAAAAAFEEHLLSHMLRAESGKETPYGKT